MDDPLFDPWDVDAGEAEERQEPQAQAPQAPQAQPPQAPARWRSPAGQGPRVPASESARPPSPEPTHAPAPPAIPPQHRAPRARLGGTAGFLRSMAVPRLEQIVARLQLARHHALVEDRLDASPPTVRFRAELRRGPWGIEGPGSSGVMELSLGEGDAGPIRSRTWLGDEESEPHSVRSIAVAKLDAATVEQLALSFLEDLVARA